MTQEQNQVTDSGREIETLKRSNPFKDKLDEPVMGETAIRSNFLTKGKRLQDITIMVGGGLEFKQYSDD